MIHAGKGHINELKGGTASYDFARQRHIGQHNHIRILRPFYLDSRIRVLFVSAEGMSFLFQLLCIFL